MLFNLTSCRHYPSKQTGKDIQCKSDCGPVFSGGWSELSAWNIPFNGEGKCLSRANNLSYGIKHEDGINLLTN